MDANEMMGYRMFGGMTPYEQTMIAHKSSKCINGANAAGLILGSVGTIAAIGAWIFGGTYANAKFNGLNQQVQNNLEHTNHIENLLATTLAAERNERVQGEAARVILNNINSGTALANANATSTAFANAEAQIVADALTGRSQLCPQPVSLYSAPKPCDCPTSDCCKC